MTELVDAIDERLEKKYPRIHVRSGVETFMNRHGAVFHIVHVPGLELICAEYCPKKEWADTYDYDPGESIWDKDSIDTLVEQLEKEIDEIEPL